MAERSELVMGSGTGASFDRGVFDRVVARRLRRIYGFHSCSPEGSQSQRSCPGRDVDWSNYQRQGTRTTAGGSAAFEVPRRPRQTVRWG